MAETSNPSDQSQHASADDVSAANPRTDASPRQVLERSGLDREGPSVATAALVGVGVALLEPELIPGILIGAGAVLAPKLFPALGGMLRPLVKGVVKAGYSTAATMREMAAEAREQVDDLVAEARAEHESGNGAPRPEQHASPDNRSQKKARQNRPSPATSM